MAIFLSGGASAERIPTPLHSRILTFPSGSFWEATETIIGPSGYGTFISKDIATHFFGGNCGNLLQNFQRRPLEKYLEDKYITREMFDTLMEFESLGIKPQQLILISQFTDVTEAQARALFDGDLPKDRVSLKPTEPGVSTNARIWRGTILATRGFEPFLNEAGKLEYRPLPVPWELDQPLASGLARPFDRSKIPFLTEIGRIHMEKEGLKGNAEKAVKLLLTYLTNEARAMKVDPNRYLLSAHLLDPQHTRLMTLAYPLRILDAKWQREIESDLDASMASYTQRTNPRGPEWQNHPNTIVLGRLAEASQLVPLPAVSEVVRLFDKRTNGKLTGPAALDFHHNLTISHRHIFDFAHPDFAKSTRPIAMRDFGTALLEGKVVASLTRLGAFKGEDQTEDLLRGMHHSGEPDSGSQIWDDRDIHVGAPLVNEANQRGQVEALKGLLVANWDISLVRSHPRAYVAAVVLAIADHLRQRLESLGDSYQPTLDRMNEYRKKLGKPQVRDLDFANFIDTYPIIVVSKHPEVMEQARDLKGRPYPGIHISFDFNHGPGTQGFHAGYQQKPTTYFGFSFDELRKLSDDFPQYARHGRRNLRPGLYEMNLRMLLSGGI